MRAKRQSGSPPDDMDAFYEYCVAVGDQASPEDALVVSQMLIDRFGDEGTPDARIRLEIAMRLKYRALARKTSGAPGDSPAVLAAVDELVERFRDAAEPQVRQGVALALSRKVWWLIEAGHYQSAIVAAEQLAERLEDERHPGLEKEIGDLLVRASKWLRVLTGGDSASGQHSVRVAAFVIDHFRGTPDLEATQLYVRALLARLDAMTDLGTPTERATLDAMVEMAEIGQPAVDVLQKLAQDNDGSAPMLPRDSAAVERAYGASCWMMRASVLSAMGRTAEALAAIDDAEERFKNDSDAVVRSMIDQAVDLRQAVREDERSDR